MLLERTELRSWFFHKKQREVYFLPLFDVWSILKIIPLLAVFGIVVKDVF